MEKQTVPFIFCYSIGGFGFYYLHNNNGHSSNIKHSIESSYPSNECRKLFKKYCEEYNASEIYNPIECINKLKAMKLTDNEQFVNKTINHFNEI